jgi:hypothetical protein
MLEEMMMNKLIVLVLALAIAAPALADDLTSAPFRGEPGSTYSEWTYDDGDLLFDYDLPENSSFVSHPDKEDPEIWDPCSGAFAGQVWGASDPCYGGDSWLPTYEGRNGVINFGYGSWDVSNFWSDPPQPAKDMWVQITYHNGTEVGSEYDFGPVAGAGDPYFDPCAPDTWGEYEGPAASWPEGMPVMWTWEDLVDPCDPCGPTEQYNWMEGELAEWDPAWPDPLGTWAIDWVEIDAELVSQQLLVDGWIHEVWALTFPDFNPDFEWFEFGFADGQGVFIDQIVIETLCYVPEPATMALLGLGSLLMIRRKR